MSNRRRVDKAEQARRTGAFARGAAAWTAKLLAVATLGAALWFGGRALHEWLTTSETFAIASIRIEGADRSAEAVPALLGLHRGDNLFRADVAGAAASLRAHPWVRDATVERDFPQGVIVTVLERRAVALVELHHLYLLDDEGEPFQRVQPGDPHDLPVITGLSRDSFRDTPDEAKDDVTIVLQTLQALEDAALPAALQPAELHLDGASGVTVWLGDRGPAVRLGAGGLPEKLGRLNQVLAEAARRGMTPDEIHLDNRARPGWVAVRLAEAKVPVKAGAGKRMTATP